MPAHNSTIRQQGFTLMELIMVIVIAGILATMTVGFITKPMEAYVDLSRRAELVDSAEMSMRMMARDIRRALPNSIRVDANGIEMINVVQGARYRSAPPGEYLEFGSTDDTFNVFGNLLPTGTISNHHLVVYNLGQPGANAHDMDGVITPSGTSFTITNNSSEQSITLGSGHSFPFESPQQRIFLVDGAISYRCEGGVLNRYGPYSIGVAPSGPTLVTRHVSNCSFEYDTGTATRSAVATIGLTLSDSTGESITLLHQVHVDNVP